MIETRSFQQVGITRSDDAIKKVPLRLCCKGTQLWGDSKRQGIMHKNILRPIAWAASLSFEATNKISYLEINKPNQ